MSGFEIVGIFLGLVAVVTGSIEHYRSRNDMRDMRQLERGFKTQRNIFENTMEELLFRTPLGSTTNQLPRFRRHCA